MALKKDFSFQNTYISTINSETLTQTDTISQSYIVVSGVNATKTLATVTVQFKSSDQASTALTKSYQFTPDVSETAVNIIKQAYRYLKTLDDFEDATDVLETGQIA